jgi:hypothetical protein
MLDASATSSGEPNNEFMHQTRAFKRRRFTTNEDNLMEADDTENSQNHAFPVHAMVARGPFSFPGTFPFIAMAFLSVFCSVSMVFVFFVAGDKSCRSLNKVANQNCSLILPTHSDTLLLILINKPFCTSFYYHGT